MHVVKGCCLWVNDADDDGDKNTIIATYVLAFLCSTLASDKFAAMTSKSL